MRRFFVAAPYWSFLFLMACLSWFSPPSFAAERWALLIGVDDYQAMSKLKYCAADAKALGDVIVARAGYDRFHVVTLCDGEVSDNRPTLANIRRRITQVAEFADQHDTLMIFFSGHGLTVGNEGFLVPSDGDADNAISINWVKDKLKQSKAAQRILILDACHAGSGAKGLSGIAPSVAAPGILMFFSSTQDQQSYPDDQLGHSVFTYHLIAALSGRAADKDRRVTGQGLADYVSKRMKEWSFQSGKSQTPLLVGNAPDTFVLAECPAEANAAIPPSPNRTEVATQTHTVVAGDSLAKISRMYYGTEAKWKLIADANQMTAPYTPKVGQKLLIPPLDAVSTPTGTGRTHTVVAGDTLPHISRRYYNDVAHVEAIYQANKSKLTSKDDLRVGMVLTIP